MSSSDHHGFTPPETPQCRGCNSPLGLPLYSLLYIHYWHPPLTGYPGCWDCASPDIWGTPSDVMMSGCHPWDVMCDTRHLGICVPCIRASGQHGHGIPAQGVFSGAIRCVSPAMSCIPDVSSAYPIWHPRSHFASQRLAFRSPAIHSVSHTLEAYPTRWNALLSQVPNDPQRE